MFLDPYYLIFMMPAFIIMLATQWYVNSSYRKWSRVPSNCRLSGAESAQQLIRTAGLYDVRIEGVAGRLNDHYDPRSKILRLSSNVYSGSSVAALAVTAHELGHALQDKEGYLPLKVRASLVPVVNIGSYLGWILIIIGLLLQWANLAWLGVLIFSGGALFALATLPVEFNASARAKRLLIDSGLVVSSGEISGINSVLNAAALTYVAALVTAIMQLLYYVTLVTGMGGRRRR